jgi:hypothetical protein
MNLSQRDEEFNGPIDYPHKSNELDDFAKAHDCFNHLDKAVRKGRAKYECPVCGADMSLAWVLYQQAIMETAAVRGVQDGELRC